MAPLEIDQDPFEIVEASVPHTNSLTDLKLEVVLGLTCPHPGKIDGERD